MAFKALPAGPEAASPCNQFTDHRAQAIKRTFVDRGYRGHNLKEPQVLLGTLDGKIHALLCEAGHNIRLILRKLRKLLLFLCAGMLAGLFKGWNWLLRLDDCPDLLQIDRQMIA